MPLYYHNFPPLITLIRKSKCNAVCMSHSNDILSCISSDLKSVVLQLKVGHLLAIFDSQQELHADIGKAVDGVCEGSGQVL